MNDQFPFLRARLVRAQFLAAALGWACVFSIGVLPAPAAPKSILLTEVASIDGRTLAQWKDQGFQALALVLEERSEPSSYAQAARLITEAGCELFLWIEVGRNPELAKAHPRWMATLGMHDDWQKIFPNATAPKADAEVAKAFPWVPIGYRESFEAHLARIEELLKRAPAGWRGLFLNDLQAGPSSCGCGNLQCRWAIDYGMSHTATKLEGDDVAARFVAEVRKRSGDKLVVPVWTTECEEVDLPPEKHQGQAGTGLCGTVGCATGTCPKAFTRQWTALVDGSSGPIALLALPRAFQRTRVEFGGGPSWITNALGYVSRTLPAHGATPLPAERLWLVVDGSQPTEERIARDLAAKTGVSGVVVARTRIEQSFEPRVLPVRGE